MELLPQQDPEYQPTREDIEAVLRRIDQDNRAVEGELARVRLSHEQRMIGILMERGSKQLLVPLIQQIETIKQSQCDRTKGLVKERDSLLQENKALKAKLGAIRYELANHVEVDRGRLLEISSTEFADEFQDLLRILLQAWKIANRYRAGKAPSKPTIRHLATLVEGFMETYPHFSKERIYREIYGAALYTESDFE